MTTTDRPIDTSPGQRVRDLLDRYGAPNASAARLLCDQHPADVTAVTAIDGDLRPTTRTYGALTTSSGRFARALAELGVGPGDRVATLMGKGIDYVVALLGIWRVGAVHVPLFTAFAPPAIALRLTGSNAKAVVCDVGQRPKLDPGGDMPADAPWLIIVAGEDRARHAADLRFTDLLEGHDAGMAPAALGGDAPLVHIFTSGTTGRPKGVVLPTSALASIHAYVEFGLDVRQDDVLWNAADPGWAYGLYYAVLGPLALGIPTILLDAGFAADRTWAVLSRFGVTNLAAAPTVYRALRAADSTPPDGLSLRCASSAGEPLTPDINDWARDALGVTVHDHYGQTETGMVVNNHHHPALRRDPRPGSMGTPMPGFTVAVLDLDRDDPVAPGEVGRIAVDVGASPLLWFRGYHGSSDRSAERFSADGRWYLTGDTGTAHADGTLGFAARDDDVIIMAGYRIGPFEVESVLATHSQVVECAAIGVPDPLRGEVLEAHVVLRDHTTATPELAAELQQLVKDRLAAHAYPRQVHFTEQLPKTPSGKIQRFVLRQQRRDELGQQEV